MGWNGSGTFTRTNGDNTGSTTWQQDKADGDKILSSRHDTHDQDLADGINACLAKNGENSMTGNLNLNSNQLQNVGTITGDATFSGDVTVNTDFEVQGISTIGLTTFTGNINATNGIFATGGCNLSGTVQMNNDATVGGDLTVTGTITNDSMPVSGSYTPEFGSTGGTFSYATQDGQYITIGDMVITTVEIIASLSGSHTGTLKVTLPFAANSSNNGGSASIGNYIGITADKGVYGFINASATEVEIRVGSDGSADAAGLNMSDVSSTVALYFTAVYIKA